jgi:Reverse transcriptase (RNA-dependent DNA polymerase)
MTISTPLAVLPSDYSSPSLNNLPTSHPSSQLTLFPSPQHPSVTSHPMTTRAKTNSLRPKQFSNHHLYDITTTPSTFFVSETEPACYTQAVKTPHWRDAMSSELTTLARNNTWQLIILPPNANIIGCKWLFKIKCHTDGTIARYKARLVANGYTQEEGLDYFDTFSPVIKPTIIRTVLTIALAQKWHIHQLDVNNTFLHGELQETIFMQQPPGFQDPLNSHKVCLLNNAIYGNRHQGLGLLNLKSFFLIGILFALNQTILSLFSPVTTQFFIF